MYIPSFSVRRNGFVFAVVVALAMGPAVIAKNTDSAASSVQTAEISGEIGAAVVQDAPDFGKTGPKASKVVPFTHGCSTPSGTIGCNQTISGTITDHGCETADRTMYANLYTFNGTAGQTFTINARSSVIDTLIILFDGSGRELGRNDDIGGGNLDSSLTATVTQTGQFTIAVHANRTVRPATGAFTLSVTCSAPPSGCTANPTTLCLNNGRFRVQTRWATSNGQSGDGQAVPITGDTGYFWFFNAANVEMVLKVLDACPSRFWVFAGGLTNVQVTMTVTDTRTGTVKTYNNPQGQAFQPIQDTNAFATCP